MTSASVGETKERRLSLSGRRAPAPSSSGRTLRLAACLGLVLVALALPNLTSSYQLYVATGGAIYLIAAGQLNILTGKVGIVSVGTAAFALVGAYVASILQMQAHMPSFLCILIAVVSCAVLGLITSPPALRLGTFAVAVITLAYANVANSAISQFPSLTGGGSGLILPQTSLTTRELWYLIVGLAGVGLLLGRNIIHSALGRALSTGKLNPLLAKSLGISVNSGRIYTFTLASAAAGLAGAMLALLNGTVSTSDFPINMSILVLVMVIAGGEGTASGPLFGVVLFTIIEAVLQQEFGTGGQWPVLIYGAFLVVIVAVMPRGIVGAAEDAWRRVGKAKRSRDSGPRQSDPRYANTEDTGDQGAGSGGEALTQSPDVGMLPPSVGSREPGVLEVVGVRKTLGGITAVQDVSITVRSGEVIGLIGPNGSGKTTLLNCISGFMPVNKGTVRINGSPLGRSATRRARAGIGRTFQQPMLFAAESAWANVLVGVERRSKSNWVSVVLRTPSARRRSRADELEARDWLGVVGLPTGDETPAGQLPPGQQRFLELARVLACRPQFLLMDEPAATLRESEVRDLERIVRDAAANGIGILLVDHNVDFMMSLCDRITVLAAGQVIASGTPGEVQANADVINVYLGHGSARAEPIEHGND